MATYSLFVPPQAVGASLVYFDLFVPAGSQSKVTLKSAMPVISGSTAVSGVVGVDLYLTRTTAVGTGGTAATYEGTSLSACTICATDNSQPANASMVTARLTPSGGATAGAVLEQTSVFTEETNSATYGLTAPLVGPEGVVINSGTGIRIVQGSVASVGNIGFNVTFEAMQR